MSAEADAVCGAPYETSSPERVTTRNWCRHRDFDTRAGTLDVAIPKLRSGSYLPDWLLERRRRAEAALTSVVARRRRADAEFVHVSAAATRSHGTHDRTHWGRFTNIRNSA
jgi:hypothetical protein